MSLLGGIIIDFDKDSSECDKCPDRGICVLYTGHGCLKEMKQSLKQKQRLNKNKA